jgi:hypothetical protein
MVLTRAYFALCLTLGRLLRSVRYSSTELVDEEDRRLIRKRRLFYAPLVVWLGNPVVRMLDTGVRILSQRDWEDRERRTYQTLGRASIRVDRGGVLILPLLTGRTLAAVLEDSTVDELLRKRAIELAVAALREFHRLELTHGDAMAENVLVDLEGGIAHWFDFETVHDSLRSTAWRRADDLRALLATCLVRTVPEQHAETVDLVLTIYGDEEVTRGVAAIFSSVWRRPLAFHLAQAPLSFECFRMIDELLARHVRVSAHGVVPPSLRP